MTAAADDNPPPAAATTTATDPTFRNYTPARAAAYARARGSYPAALYDVILARHAQTGGQQGTILDVGCGPGNMLRELAPAFERAIGCDAGEEMVEVARGLGGGTTGNGGEVVWKRAGAEELAEVLGGERAGVDLVTVAMAAHWFDMPAFWKQAAQLVKPGGSVAIFAKCSFFCHPSTPNIATVQRVFDTFERVSLAPHSLPGNRLCRDFYRDLALPWQSDNPSPEFPEALFERHTWNVDGALDGPDGDDFFGGSVMLTPAKIAELLASTGPVQRWREAHPREAGTEMDAVAVMLRELEGVVGVGGEVRMGMGYALLFFKRR